MPLLPPFRKFASPFFALLAAAALPARAANDCDGWQSRHPEWIFCDDFEKAGALIAQGRYFEYDDNKGDFKPVAGTGLRGSTGMRAAWQAAEVDAGNLKLGFGRAPGSYFSKGIRTSEDFREIFYRVFVRMQKGWKGNPYKLSRATVIAKTDWSQAMIAHLWGDRADGLQLDPVRCTDASGAVKCSGYNDFNNMQWIGAKAGPMPIYAGGFDDRWLCVETHVRLNSAGKADGVHEYWIGDTLQARREGLDFLGGYKEYGINGVFFENYWNSASPRNQERYFDDIVVSTQRIGCAEGAEAPSSLSTPGIGKRGSTGVGILRTEGIPTISVDGETWSITGRKIPQKRAF